MTVVDLTAHRASAERILTPQALPESCLEVLRDRIDRAVRAASDTDRVEDVLLSRVLRESVDAFITSGGDPQAAAELVAPWLERIGERQARLGADVESLADAFRCAQSAAQKGLRDAVGRVLVGDPLTAVREALMAYVSLLYRHARTGMERVQAMAEMSEAEKTDRLRKAAFERTSNTALRDLAAAAGLPLNAWYVAVVCVEGDVPPQLRDHPRTLAHASEPEVLVPSTWTSSRIAGMLENQAVSGPAAALADAADAVMLARRAATLLRDAQVSDERRLVPCTDLLGELLISTDSLLTELIGQKHLGPLEEMRPSRRLNLAKTVLHWLERGVTANQLARDLGIPPQTVHSRLKAAKATFGDALDDPTQRLELIVALRTAIARWHESD
ncbi:helix-turn-helix domain-containing protein [Aeromicrobium sp. CTD01-1L150]|uniref:PucR family transcriptional regulator n=1 Tax=Aeromicrobium sp. CTD01-1L150 TaxID=3341830 RepID=UPI0035C166FA